MWSGRWLRMGACAAVVVVVLVIAVVDRGGTIRRLGRRLSPQRNLALLRRVYGAEAEEGWARGPVLLGGRDASAFVLVGVGRLSALAGADVGGLAAGGRGLVREAEELHSGCECGMVVVDLKFVYAKCLC
jgi:hypothetical protein